MNAGDPHALAARRLAAEAVDLATKVGSLHGALPDDIRGYGYHLSDVVGQLRRIARELDETADHFARHRDIPPGSCPHESAGCPEHGLTLSYGSGRSWCRHVGCGREWDHDRARFPCDQPVALRVVAPQGWHVDVCRGHAQTIVGEPGWRVEPLSKEKP